LLNALLVEDLAAPITHVDILNPCNEREILDATLFRDRPECIGLLRTDGQFRVRLT
jgi:hypothetical protein